MYAVQRTHAHRRDRDWLPPSVRRVGRVTSGAIWAGAGAALAGTLAIAPPLLVFWKAIALGGVGVAVAGERAGRLAFRRKLAQMTRGEIPLAEVSHRQEGELVCVNGRVDAGDTLTGILHGTAGVYRRLVFRSAGGLWVHEAAVDFALVDEANHRILVQAAGARWLAPSRELISYRRDKLDGDDVPRAVKDLVRRGGGDLLEAFEHVLEPGAPIQIVGYKTAAAAVDGDVVDYRSPPQRATLRSGPDLPLVITRKEDLTA